MAKSGVEAGRKLYEQAKASEFANYYVGEAYLRGLGKAYFEAQRFAEAIAFAQWNVEQFPKSVQARADLADAIFASGQLDLAQQAYRSVLELDSSNARARSQIDLIDKPVEMQFADTNGQAVDLTRFRGKVVLIDVWATWCVPCTNEIPNRVAAYKKYHQRGFEIVGVSFDIVPTDPPNPRLPAKTAGEMKAFAESRHVFWPQYYDGQGFKNRFAQQLGVDAIPASFLLDERGKIVAVNLRGPQLDAALEQLLGK
jgi:peroxiredoxin